MSFIKGSRSKYLELEDYYKRIDDIELAKKSIFQHWGRYTAEEEFMSGITIQQAKFFKQAVIAVELADVQRMQEEVVLKGIKENGSSMLALGPRL